MKTQLSLIPSDRGIHQALALALRLRRHTAIPRRNGEADCLRHGRGRLKHGLNGEIMRNVWQNVDLAIYVNYVNLTQTLIKVRNCDYS